MHRNHSIHYLYNVFSRLVESNLHGQGSSVIDWLTPPVCSQAFYFSGREISLLSLSLDYILDAVISFSLSPTTRGQQKMRWEVVPLDIVPASPRVEAWKNPERKLQTWGPLKDWACLVEKEKKQSRQWFIYENLSSDFHKRGYDTEMLTQ